jgi:NagD protein
VQKHCPPDHLYDAYLIDLDGTVYLGGERLLPGALETLERLRNTSVQTFAAQPAGQARRVIFLTNEASRPRSFFAGRLQHLGIPAEPVDILNASAALVELLRSRLPGGRLFVIGESPLEAELEAAGFCLVDDPRLVQAVIASNDHSFDSRKLKMAFDAIRLGALFFATNADRALLLPDGTLEPDAAPVIAAIEACTGHPLDELAGKPATWMAEAALRQLGLPPDHCLVVGDNLETDIAMGVRAGIPAALVLSGVSSQADLAVSPVQPAYVIRDLSELIPGE